MQLHCRNSIQKRFDFLTAESEFESDKNVLEFGLQSEFGLQYYKPGKNGLEFGLQSESGVLGWQ